ncbi:MAG: hypothetical protein ABI885_01140 [Gammaproteobacteria bacterium]
MIVTRSRKTKVLSRLAMSFCAALLSLQPLQAMAAVVGPVTLEIPQGFQPAQTQRNGKTLISAWTKSSRDKHVKALLQVSIYDYSAKLAKTPASEMQAGAEKYLREFLGGIERRRSQYSQSAVTQMVLAGAPAARAAWHGKIGPMDVVGVMYSTILDNRYVVSLHTQDLGMEPTSAMLEAMHAIEALQLTPAP